MHGTYRMELRDIWDRMELRDIWDLGSNGGTRGT